MLCAEHVVEADVTSSIWLIAACATGAVCFSLHSEMCGAQIQESSMTAVRGIEEGLYAPINGVNQWVTIRGRDRSNPALLIVGGVGVALSRMAPVFAPWETSFNVVQWDQPGAGTARSADGAVDATPVTLQRIVDDGISVASFVRDRLRIQKLVLIGFSSGSTVGLEMIRRRPELFSAFVGTGQIVHWQRQDAASYRLVLDRARAEKNRAAIDELEQIGPPPYQTAEEDALKSKYANALTKEEQQMFASLSPSAAAALRMPPADATYVPKGFEELDVRKQSFSVYLTLRRQLTSFDAWSGGLRFDVPLFMFQGELDQFTVTAEVERFLTEARSPAKRLMLIRGGGHSALFLRDEFLRLLNEHVRPLAIERAGG